MSKPDPYSSLRGGEGNSRVVETATSCFLERGEKIMDIPWAPGANTSMAYPAFPNCNRFTSWYSRPELNWDQRFRKPADKVSYTPIFIGL
jgi:hypothetical protein